MNDSVSWWRRARRVVGELGSSLPASEPGFPDPDIRAAVDGLPLRQRQAIALRVVLGFDAKETAAILGIAPGTVGVHLSRALEGCRERLAPKDRSSGTEGENDG
jgi:RNA polymerase sigma-70 factor (ECF subfamily)